MMELTAKDEAMLEGKMGEAAQTAMRILITMAGVYGAERLLDIESAHIDGCLYHGYSGLEFARRLAAGGARVVVPATLNVGAMDLLHPEYFRGATELGRHATELMTLYEAMGCRSVFTCAPYQAAQRPAPGTQIAWAESNAIVFANSVLGARTNRYGDFIDICCAITGRAPAVGLHLAENRRGRILFRLTGVPERLRQEDALFPVLGYFIGARSGSRIPVIEGLPPTTTEDQLKALGAAAASSGAVALFHVVGVTPEAPTLEAAFQGRLPETIIDVTMDDLRRTLSRLSTAPDGRIDVVALGSPHFSPQEFAQLMPLLERYPPDRGVEFIVCTNRIVLAALQRQGRLERLRQAGVQVVVDTCVVVTSLVKAREGVLMTNSGKFAHYSPGNIGLQVVFGSLEECVRSAAQGRVWRDETLWRVDEAPDAGAVRPSLDGPADIAGNASPPPDGASPQRPDGEGKTRTLVPGSAAGQALKLDEPLSLWGGLDPETGAVIDQRHPQWGENLAGRILVMPAGKGSSSASSILLEAVRLGTAPAAILLAEPDAILALGAAVAREMYDQAPPVVVLDKPTYDRIRTGDRAAIDATEARTTITLEG